MTKQVSLLVILLFTLSCASNSQNNYNEVSLPELMKKKQQGGNNMVIVDVRSDGEFYDTVSRNRQANIGRIKGALHVTVQDLQSNPDAVKQLEPYKDKDIYLICSHSYRSRAASNVLLKNGFTHVNNVRGGMTEWYRRYDEMAPYMNEFYETGNSYKNVSAAQVANDLIAGKDILLIGISGTPRFFYDTATMKLYTYIPLFKNAVYYNYGDSLQVLEKVKKEKGRPVVLFNMINNGAAELADWLTHKGYPASYMVGGNYYFDEYTGNKELNAKINKFMVKNNNIDFITPVNYCSKVTANKDVKVIDLRHDTLFNKMSSGIKYDFRYLNGSVNFFAGKGENAFMQEFPDKKKEYALMSQNGIDGIELADALTKKGYKIYWLLGGLQRLEWYTINVETFTCKDVLVR